MDVVIPFRSSINLDKELIYALRSMEINLPGMGHVWVIGDTPRWAYNPAHLTIIPFPDIYRENHFRDRNIMNKMVKAAKTPEIPDRFLLAHDDNFILNLCEIENWPYYYKDGFEGKGDYALTEANTKELLGNRI